MKTTLDLPEDLVREMKLRAVRQGRTVKALAADLLRNGLGMQQLEIERYTSDRIVIDENGFPTIRCGPNAPAKSMSTDELVQLEKESLEAEDLARFGITV